MHRVTDSKIDKKESNRDKENRITEREREWRIQRILVLLLLGFPIPISNKNLNRKKILKIFRFHARRLLITGFGTSLILKLKQCDQD